MQPTPDQNPPPLGYITAQVGSEGLMCRRFTCVYHCCVRSSAALLFPFL